MDYFKSHADEYENFLLIDCDAFPVCPNWQEILTKKMEESDRWYAALLRTEHFEGYPWLGLFYLRGKYVNEDIPDWFPRPYEDLMGHHHREFGTTRNKTHHDGKSIWYPLLRSNVLNPHPIRFGIYNHLFYHHMKGSWNKDDLNWKADVTVNCNVENYGYFDHYMKRSDHPAIAERCHEKLMTDSENFLCELMGVDSNWFKGKI
jgi:hypothetical protein